MSANQGQESAQIYQFPAGGRAALGGKRYDEFKALGVQASPRVNEAACSDSWYHQEAIQTDERGRDH
jgi:hypothetical protein